MWIRKWIELPDILAINVIVLSDNDLKFGLTTSSIANADKLLSPDERVLQQKYIQIIYTNVDSNMVRYMKKMFYHKTWAMHWKGTQ